ncbi:peptidase domain-containing ABC transporter [Acinetobacter oleivorans]|uniref:peptidase domain-containing ABC transporter n=1 Tax=Acinetobacter oleivorans TaxID=1148157 RepID=UPI001CD531F8|nr:peptidase domain-containing ABC transporter [Acinetobacter oleivorans]
MKTFLKQLNFSFSSAPPIILQTEVSECGLACLAMISNYYGHDVDLMSLRSRFSISSKGTNLEQLINISQKLNLISRPLKLTLDDLYQLRLPCILHWDFNHFVVLTQIKGKKITILDPAFGQRNLTMAEVSNHFTGIALELWPSPLFEKKQERNQIKIFSMIAKVKGIWRSLSQILILAVVLEVFALISPFFMQWVIDHVIVSADRDLLTILAIGFGVVMLLQQLIGLLRSWLMMYMSTHLNIQWRSNVLSHLIHVPVSYFERRSLGDIVSRFGSIDSIQRTLTSTFLSAILDGLMTVFTLILMFIYSEKLTYIAIFTMVLYGVIRWIWYYPLRQATEAQIIHTAKQNSHFMETIRGAKTIKLFQRQEIRLASWLTLLVNQINAGLTTQKLGLMFQFINSLLFGIQNIVIIWLGAHLVLDNVFTVGILMAFMAYKGQFDSRVAGLIDKFIEVKMLQVDAERLSDIVLTEPEKLYHDEIATHVLEKSNNILELKNLKFKYSEQEPYVLNGIDLTIKSNESVAIVGKTGCGKTTLLHVLLGVFPPTEGEVLLSGRSISQIGVNSMREQIGTVLQDDVLFAGTIADNICFFDPSPDQRQIESCAKLASIHLDINNFPMGYQTLVGEMGSMLSGGQKQRILLARALYKKPKILFLDESTSHLDIETERKVNHNLKLLQITKIMIAHRPETIASADRVVVLSQGQVFRDEYQNFNTLP